MGLYDLKTILQKAREEKYCVPAFDASTINMAQAIIEAAEEENSPVIIMGLKVDLEGEMLNYWINSVRDMGEKASVPVCIHLDHAVDMDLLKKCCDIGFTSVMIDASTKEFEENIKTTKEAVDYAHARGVSVEAELGHVGDGIVSGKENPDAKEGDIEDTLTNPEDLKEFVDQTKVDCLAVAVGTQHGVYIAKPKLDFERLNELNEISEVPLVLHGGSGTPDDQLQKAIELGVCKLNIYSEILNAYYSEMKKQLNETENMSIWVSVADKRPIERMKEVVKEKIRVCSSSGRA